ncbi:hypothetical protein [Aurantimonas sp. NFXS3]|uniref:hypothetical protein n=1 Tax=Aurantimonas sp. NFXS3 TaxID=2818434 RepID=UPI003B8E05EA
MEAKQHHIQQWPVESEHDAAQAVCHNPQWTAFRNALDAGFSATEAKYMLDLSDDQVRNYFRCIREPAR